MVFGRVDTKRLRHHATKAKEVTIRAGKVVHRHAFSSWKRIAVSVGVLLVVTMVVFQFVYPTNAMLPNSSVGSVKLDGISETEAALKLDEAYEKVKVELFLSDSDVSIDTPSYKDLGVFVSNEDRVAAYDYPWYMRLVPTSLFWYQAAINDGEPKVSRDAEILNAYIVSQFGENCQHDPINATIVFEKELKTKAAVSGGTCDRGEVDKKLSEVPIELDSSKLVFNGTTVAPAVSTDTALTELDRLNKQLEDGIALKVNGKTEVITKEVAEQWVEYSVVENTLTPGLNYEKASAWLNEKYASQFAVAPGTTVVTTQDFTETSRVTGKSGQALNAPATIAELVKELKGETSAASIVVSAVAPKVTYNRSYSGTDAGLSAVMRHFAETHPGTYGIKMIELSGARRNAEYNGTKQFTTASTYKMFVAYSTLLRIESGAWKWTDQITGGKDVSRCFDDMIKLSDNACAEAFLKKIDYRPITNEARAIGATSTSFLGSDGVKSTAADEALLLSLLHSGQILSQQSSRDRFIGALKGNVYRRGIPAGVPGMTVANKVGFLDGLLHDAGIVYSPSGVYVLVILTDGSSWANIAELAKEIEAVRTK